MSRKYTSALGKSIDMAALALKNEKVRAVGNMNVNARGDTIDSDGNVINDATKRVSTYYNSTTVNKGAVAGTNTAPAPGSEIASAPVQASVSESLTISQPSKTVRSRKPKQAEPQHTEAELKEADAFNEPNPEK
jgi:hypothetical protein